ncbi:hypothetical protein GALMADRAFT_245627, partial [Galerina marginata CBS 339.88]
LSLPVGNGTDIGLFVLTLIGVTIPLLMATSDSMIRTNGTKVTTPRHPSWKVETYGLWLTLKADPMIILLFPMFLASNWFNAWQFNDYNDALFNIRARALNNLVYWLSQIVGSIAIGFVLDQKYISRRIRAFSGWVVLLVMVFIVHIWAYLLPKSAGGAGSWRADVVKTPFMNMLISTWVLLVAGAVFSLPMIYLRVKDQTDLADETLVRMDDSRHIRDTRQVARERVTRTGET